MTTRMQVTLPDELLRHARRTANARGISTAEYIRRLLRADAAPQGVPADVRGLFDLGDSGGSDVARHVGSYLAAAASAG